MEVESWVRHHPVYGHVWNNLLANVESHGFLIDYCL